MHQIVPTIFCWETMRLQTMQIKDCVIDVAFQHICAWRIAYGDVWGNWKQPATSTHITCPCKILCRVHAYELANILSLHGKNHALTTTPISRMEITNCINDTSQVMSCSSTCYLPFCTLSLTFNQPCILAWCLRRLQNPLQLLNSNFIPICSAFLDF